MMCVSCDVIIMIRDLLGDKLFSRNRTGKFTSFKNGLHLIDITKNIFVAITETIILFAK